MKQKTKIPACEAIFAVTEAKSIEEIIEFFEKYKGREGFKNNITVYSEDWDGEIEIEESAEEHNARIQKIIETKEKEIELLERELL